MRTKNSAYFIDEQKMSCESEDENMEEVFADIRSFCERLRELLERHGDLPVVYVGGGKSEYFSSDALRVAEVPVASSVAEEEHETRFALVVSLEGLEKTGKGDDRKATLGSWFEKASSLYKKRVLDETDDEANLPVLYDGLPADVDTEHYNLSLAGVHFVEDFSFFDNENNRKEIKAIVFDPMS